MNVCVCVVYGCKASSVCLCIFFSPQVSPQMKQQILDSLLLSAEWICWMKQMRGVVVVSAPLMGNPFMVVHELRGRWWKDAARVFGRRRQEFSGFFRSCAVNRWATRRGKNTLNQEACYWNIVTLCALGWKVNVCVCVC